MMRLKRPVEDESNGLHDRLYASLFLMRWPVRMAVDRKKRLFLTVCPRRFLNSWHCYRGADIETGLSHFDFSEQFLRLYRPKMIGLPDFASQSNFGEGRPILDRPPLIEDDTNASNGRVPTKVFVLTRRKFGHQLFERFFFQKYGNLIGPGYHSAAPSLAKAVSNSKRHATRRPQE
jgi:hypothetical protein